MRISPAREAALAFLHEDRWLKAGDWDERVGEQISRHRLDDARDRRLFSYLVAGCVRLRGRLDARLVRLTGRQDLDSTVRTALRLALYQLEEMDRVPAHAAIGESVEWVRRRRGARLGGWVNAQLRRWQREGVPGRDPDPETEAVAHGRDVLSYPEWLVRRWLAELGQARALAVMTAMNEAPAACFRWNALRPGREDFLTSLRAGGIGCEEPEGLPQALRLRGAWPGGLRPALERGDLSVQDASAQHIAPLLSAGLGGDWVDLCAAPGGKCTHLAELTGDEREILAIDRSAARLEKVVANAGRLGLSRLRIEAGDVLTLPARPMDGVLLDAPCSSLGVLAANPDARWRRSEAQVAAAAALQARLLAAAARWLGPGGRLVYSVCTFTPEETAGQREDFLAAHPDLHLEPIGPDEVPARFLTPAGELLLLPDQDAGGGSYAFRCRREGAAS